jgi:hypothetical protein
MQAEGSTSPTYGVSGCWGVNSTNSNPEELNGIIGPERRNAKLHRSLVLVGPRKAGLPLLQ